MGEMNEGDEIIVPANTFIASLLAISDNQLVPVLVEPDINTYNIDPQSIEEKALWLFICTDKMPCIQEFSVWLINTG
jgi:hypothetical protein